MSADLPGALAARLQGDGPWIVGYSGGLDSTVLLHAACLAVGSKRIIAAHVHHGLQTVADHWPGHCAAQAQALGVRFQTLRIEQRPDRADSLEAWAREHRYRLLAQIARELNAQAVLTAHHQDDQLETILMRMRRGTGLDGLLAIAPQMTREGVCILRPLLEFDRAALLDHAQAFGLRWIEDPSNADLRRTRNEIRHRLLPRMREQDPAFGQSLLRALPALRQLSVQRRGQARDDLDTARSPQGLSRRALRELPAERLKLALREWLRELQLQMPSRARLDQICLQLVHGQSAHGQVNHEGMVLVRDRDSIRAVVEPLASLPAIQAGTLVWQGEASLRLSPGAGTLYFRRAPADLPGSLSRDWLLGVCLELTPGAGGAGRLRPRAASTSRSLKNLYQERGIPGWMRRSLPVIRHQQRVLYAAGVGMDCSADWPRDGECVSIEWQSEHPVVLAALPVDIDRRLKHRPS